MKVKKYGEVLNNYCIILYVFSMHLIAVCVGNKLIVNSYTSIRNEPHQ
jgi:hypothetical protein